MTNLTTTLGQLTEDLRQRSEQMAAVAAQQQLADGCRSLQAAAHRTRSYARAVRMMNSRNQAQVEAGMAAEADVLEGLLPNSAASPVELMQAIGQAERGLAAIETTLKEVLASRHSELRNRTSQTRQLAQNLGNAPVVATCSDALTALNGFFTGLPDTLRDFAPVQTAVDAVTTARKEMRSQLGPLASDIEDFLNRAATGGYPLDELTPELLIALQARGVASSMRATPAN